uniref:Phospholipase A-2-activating protein n=1 Tax=Attheya septentrionalis TaxID=420275 RepID=A0A7S2ULF7_9STRA|mmetsp:Transcript_3476/g.6351  ORF Transcript_3476/g.6351 Transcript_3476/m.6351 type:complete len:839 (+) Transcript_3476:197-2713(+)
MQVDSLDEYQLSVALLSDAEPVRALGVMGADDDVSLLSGSQGGLVSVHEHVLDGSRRNTLIQPGGTEGNNRHPHQISSLLVVSPNDSTGKSKSSSSSSSNSSYYVTGCKDSKIRVFDGTTHELLHTLAGHENAVTSLSLLSFSNDDSTRALVSGSWDGTAKLWKWTDSTISTVIPMLLTTLEGHENTVSVCALPPDSSAGSSFSSGRRARLCTGSAGIAEGNVIRDHSVRVWDVLLSQDGRAATATLVHRVANDHDGPIRDMAFDVDANVVVTCSNDGTIKLRNPDTGTTVSTYTTTFLSSPPMLLSVICLGQGKYVSTSEDGNAHFWDTATGSTQVIGHPNTVWKALALPNTNGDFCTACHDGSVRIFTKDVLRAASTEEQVAFQKEVELARQKTQSGPSQEEIAKLPKWELNALQQGRSEGMVQVFNKGGKAIAAQWSAASSTWIEVGEVTGMGGTSENAGSINGVQYDHVLPIEIDLPSGGLSNLQIGYNAGQNPFVVAQAFIDEHMLDQNYLAQIADYIRQRVGDAAGPTLGDGSTGNTAPTSTSTAMDITMAPPPKVYQHLPMKGFLSFETGADAKTLGKISSKLSEFNTDVSSFNDTDLSALPELIQTLAMTNRYHATKMTPSDLAVLHTLIRTWDCSRVFPALDLARLTVLHPDASKSQNTTYWSGVIQCALEKCKEVVDQNVQGTAAVAVPMLSLRLFANCFKGGSGSLAAASTNIVGILECAQQFCNSSNKNIRLSVATVLLNASSYVYSTKNTNAIPPIVSLGSAILTSGLYETEAIVRSLVAMGTVLLVSSSSAVEDQVSLLNQIQLVAAQHGDKAKSIAAEIQSIF